MTSSPGTWIRYPGEAVGRVVVTSATEAELCSTEVAGKILSEVDPASRRTHPVLLPPRTPSSDLGVDSQ